MRSATGHPPVWEVRSHAPLCERCNRQKKRTCRETGTTANPVARPASGRLCLENHTTSWASPNEHLMFFDYNSFALLNLHKRWQAWLNCKKTLLKLTKSPWWNVIHLLYICNASGVQLHRIVLITYILIFVHAPTQSYTVLKFGPCINC